MRLFRSETATDTFSDTFDRNLYFNVFKDAGTRSFLEIGFVFHQVDLATVAYINGVSAHYFSRRMLQV